MKKTVKDMKCGYCGVIGHTARTCEEKKKNTIKEERKAKMKQAKRFYYTESKMLSQFKFLNTLTEEGKIALMNNRFMTSKHFLVATKPETAVQENLIEPMFEAVEIRAKTESCKTEYIREPQFTTVDNKNKYLDYLLTVSYKGHKHPVKWLIEAEAPNQTHKGIQQVEDFVANVPNISGYRFIVTDGYWYHFCLPTLDSVLEWKSYTIDDKSFLMENLITGTILDVDPLQNLKRLGILVGILALGVIANFI